MLQQAELRQLAFYPAVKRPSRRRNQQTARPRSRHFPSTASTPRVTGSGTSYNEKKKKKKKAIPFISSLSLYCHHNAELVPSPLPPTFTSGYQGLEGLKMETLPRVHTPAVLLGSGWMDGWMNGGPGSSSRRPLQDHRP